MGIGFFIAKKIKAMPLHPKIPPIRTEFIQSQGLPIALSVLKNSPAATTVLFYPGTMSSPLMYSVLLQELYLAGFNVVGLHPLGHRFSSKAKKAFTFEDIMQNGKDAENFIRQNFSGPLVVCGHSQGGILALAHSINNLHVAACFSINTLLPHRPEAALVTRFAFAMRHRQKYLSMLRFFARILPTFPVPLWLYLQPKRIFAHLYKVSCPEANCLNSYPLAFISSLFHLNLHSAEEEGNIHCPFYLFAAQDDTLFPLSMMQELFAHIQAEKTCIVLNGGGHLCALSTLYSQNIARHMAAACAGRGLHIHAQ